MHCITPFYYNTCAYVYRDLLFKSISIYLKVFTVRASSCKSWLRQPLSRIGAFVDTALLNSNAFFRNTTHTLRFALSKLAVFLAHRVWTPKMPEMFSYVGVTVELCVCECAASVSENVSPWCWSVCECAWCKG